MSLAFIPMCLHSLCLFTPLAGALFSCLSSSNFLVWFSGLWASPRAGRRHRSISCRSSQPLVSQGYRSAHLNDVQADAPVLRDEPTDGKS